MNSTAKNILAIVAGFVAGSTINMGLITAGMSLIPTPEGLDFSNMDAVRENMKLLSPQHFVFPFLGHALGTLAGAFVASKIAASHAMKLAIAIGVLFLLGGIAMILNCGGPTWFVAADLLLAYIPMAMIGGRLGQKPSASTSV